MALETLAPSERADNAELNDHTTRRKKEAIALISLKARGSNPSRTSGFESSCGLTSAWSVSQHTSDATNGRQS